MNKSSIYIKYAFFVLVLTAFSVIFAPRSVSAGFNELPNMLPEPTEGYQPFIHLSNNDNDDSSGVGSHTTTVSVKIYSTAKINRTIRLEYPSNDDCDAVIATSISGITDADNQPINPPLTEDYRRNEFGSCGNIRITIPGDRFVDSNIPGREGISVAMIRIELASAGDTASFRVHTLGDFKIGFLGAYPYGGGNQGNDNPLSSNNHLSNTAVTVRGGSSGGDYDFGAVFAAPCTFYGPNPVGSPSRQVRIFWKDADSRDRPQDTPPQENPDVTSDNDPVRVKLIDLTTGSEIIPLRDAGSGDSIHSVSGVDIVYRHKYLLKFEGMRKKNGIRVWFPFDSAGGSFNCPPGDPPTPNCMQYTKNVWTGYRYRFSFFQGSGVFPGGITRGISEGAQRDYADIPWINWPHAGNSPTRTDFQNGPDPDYSYNYPTMTTGWTVVVERWEHTGSTWTYRGLQFDRAGPCQASCSVSINSNVDGATLPNSVKANEPYTAIIRLTNNGPQALPRTHPNGSRLGLNGDYGAHYSSNIDPGDSWEMPISVTAPGSVGSYAVVNKYPDYVGFQAIGGWCNTTINVYREYDVGAVARINSADNENPTAIDYTVGGSGFIINPGVNVVIPTQANIIRQNADGTYSGSLDTLVNSSQTYAPWTKPPPNVSTAVNRTIIPPGAFYCVRTVLAPGHGWVGPPVSGGASSNIAGIENRQNEQCERVVNKPYVRFYGQDVFAGGNFPNETQTNGGIDANYRANAIGSGVEYAAFALGSIDRFASNNMKTDGAFDLLNFASTPTKGNFGAEHVATDYFANMPLNVRELPTTGSVDVSSINNESVHYNGNVSLDASSALAPGTSRTLFVDGDVVIRNNITYTNWGTDINAIPNFRLFVKGNIYIASNVGQIDGLLVAQPTETANTGQLHTCTQPNGSPYATTDGALWNNCGSKLTINGAVVAQKVKWLRTFRTLSDALSGGLEPYNSTNATEVINTSPEIYFGRPADPPIGGDTSGKYDSYQALPPIL